MEAIIYYICSLDEIPRYVGKTLNIKNRLSGHKRDKANTRKTAWIKSVGASNLQIHQIDEVPENEWSFWEIHYISLFKSWGYSLVNSNDGGEGGNRLFGKDNPYWKGGISEKLPCPKCGKMIPPQQKTCMGCQVYQRNGENNSFFGKSHSNEMKEALRKKMIGKKPTNSRPVNINSIHYASATEAARSLEVCTATILHRIKSPNKKYLHYFYTATGMDIEG